MRFRPDLEKEARDLLAKASVIAEAPGASIIPPGSRTYTSREPTGDPASSTYDYFRRLVERCRTDAELEWAIRKMRDELKRLHTPAPRLSNKEIERRILVEFEGTDAAWVAHSLGVTLEYVCQVRRRNGRVPATGRIREGASLAWATKEERQERVRQLHRDEPDLSWREIAQRLGVAHKTVLRDAEELGLRKPERRAA